MDKYLRIQLSTQIYYDFKKYLTNIGLAPVTIHKYQQCLNFFYHNIRKWSNNENFYDILNPKNAIKIVNDIMVDPNFINEDRANHKMFSSALKHYVKFIQSKYYFSSPNLKSISFSKTPNQLIFCGNSSKKNLHEIALLANGYDTDNTKFNYDSNYSDFVGCNTLISSLSLPTLSIHDLAMKLKGYCNNPNMNILDSIQRFVYEYYMYLNGQVMSADIEKILNIAGISLAYQVELRKYVSFCGILPKRTKYEFIKQAFLKAYLGAWKKYAEGKMTYSTPMPRKRFIATPGVQGNHSSFIYDKKNYQYLNIVEKSKLIEVDNFAFSLVGYGNLGDLHKKVKVIVTDYPENEQIITKTITKNDIDNLEDKIKRLDEKAKEDETFYKAKFFDLYD